MTEHVNYPGGGYNRSGSRLLTRIPDGWTHRLTSEGKLLIVHQDHRPREFDPVTERWSEFDGSTLVEMDPQP